MGCWGTGELDSRLLAVGYGGGRPELAAFARAVTFLGSGWFLIPLSALAAFAFGLRTGTRSGLLLFAGTLLGRGLIEAQKIVTGRPRPDAHPALADVHTLSFPSGHSANSMLVLLALALLLARGRSRPWWIAAALALSVAIGVSRIMLGVHWPSDVVAGWAFGCAGAVLLAHLARQHTTVLQPGSR